MAAISGAAHLASEVTGLFDEIRSKAGVSGSMTWAQAAEAVAGIEAGGGGGYDDFDLYCMGALASVPPDVAGAVSMLNQYALYNNMASLAEFPTCSYINVSAFFGCAALAKADFPICTTVSQGAFNGCTALTEVDFPACTTIGTQAFYLCAALAKADFPACTYVGVSAFYGCYTLTEVDFPECTRVDPSAFAGCSNLTKASFPKCVSVGACAFNMCSILGEISLPRCSIITNSAFAQCWCLLSVYLLGSSVVSLVSTGAFMGTPLLNYTAYTGISGSVFVPESLYQDYVTASNWSIIKARIVSLTDDEIAALG